MEVKTDILRHLNKNKMENAFLIRVLETHPKTETHVFGASVAVYEPLSGSWLFRLDKEGDFTKLYSRLNAPVGTFYVSGKAFFDEMKTVFPNARGQEYVQYVMFSKMFVFNPEAVNPEIEVVAIDKSWTDFILSIYKSEEFCKREYIESCIDLNPGYGALLDGEKVGEVAGQLNYSSAYAFSKAFKKYFGLSPNQYLLTLKTK